MTQAAPAVASQPGEHLIENGLFRIDEAGTPLLRGSRCPDCGATFVGTRAICLGCFHVGLDPADLSDRGEVYSFTTVRQQSPDSLIQPPYTVVQVKLPEGVIVRRRSWRARLTRCSWAWLCGRRRSASPSHRGKPSSHTRS